MRINHAFWLALPVALCLSACKTERDIPYQTARHYFATGGVKKTELTVMSTAEQLFKKFDMAAVMGKNGEPTKVDFNKSSVIGIVAPDTNCPTELIPVSLKKKKDMITLLYKAERGDPSSYTSRPCLLIIVDKDKLTTQIESREME